MSRDTLLYEFRSFGQSFGTAEQKMLEVATTPRLSESYDYYILSATNNRYNVLIRNKMLIIKELIKNDNEFERWNVNLSEKFPITRDIIENQFFPAIGLEPPAIENYEYEIQDFIDNIITVDPDIKIVSVYKKKTEFLFNDCNCEIAENLINGAFIKTFNIESENIENIVKTKEIFGIGKEYENTNYPLAIKRIISLEPQKEYKF